MAFPSIKFKNLLTKNNRMDRQTILDTLNRWLGDKCSDPKICALSNWLSTLSGNNSWMSEKEFKDSSHWMWMMASSFNDLDVFQQIVKHKLGIPPTPVLPTIDANGKTRIPRKTIPKKIREQAWIDQFGDTMKGKCYCCNTEFVHGDSNWHAGHIVSSKNGGSDDVTNIRIVCASCNLSMGTENMNDFKQRCYSQLNSTQVILNGKVMNILINTH